LFFVNSAQKHGIKGIYFGMITRKGGIFMKKRRDPILLQESGMVYQQGSPTAVDPLGSYTGVPENPWETPVQDADDL
jgi:hypothetical protein